jgi:RNA polymerase sigma factor (sigma-70 family)
MSEKMSGTDSDSTDQTAKQAVMPASEAKVWFVQEILPLEALLTRFLRKNWRNPNDIEDLRQEIYAHVLKAAEAKVPDRAKGFLFATARNLLVDHLRRENIVPIEIVAELDIIAIPAGDPGPERQVFARDTLRRLQLALNDLPPRCREAVILRRIEGLSRREIAQRMGISQQAVANHVARGMFVLADLLFDETSELGTSHDRG